MLAATSRWFHRVIMEDSIWKYVCLRDLQVPAPCHMSFKWIDLYASAFGKDHSSLYRVFVHGLVELRVKKEKWFRMCTVLTV